VLRGPVLRASAKVIERIRGQIVFREEAAELVASEDLEVLGADHAHLMERHQ
jgi:hypothetical protein